MQAGTAELGVLKDAVNLALSGDWHGAHHIAQDSNHPVAHWIHAVLHKIESDEWNSRYWYRRTDRRYEDFVDPRAELQAILEHIDLQS
jgi:hypothetical protein